MYKKIQYDDAVGNIIIYVYHSIINILTYIVSSFNDDKI